MLFVTLQVAPGLRAQAPPPGSGPIEFDGFVRVIDGDTLEAYINGRRSGIGIIGIRTPMGNTSCGRTATAFLQALIGGNHIRLEEDPTVAPYDARKRRMYRLVVADGRSAAVALAAAGLTVPSGEGMERNEIAAEASGGRAGGRGCVRSE